MDLWKDPDLPPELAAKYAGEAATFWDLFYQRNETKFFKDRHWFANEFPQLLAPGITVLEVGCGVGNSLFPLLELNPSARAYACDFAPSAVRLVKAHPLYDGYHAAGRANAFVADITADDLTASVPPGSVDVCTMVFVLSAVAPEAMPRALRSVAATLRPGGTLLFRDYAAGDLAQGRLAGDGRQTRLADACYVRWDGTLAYYFAEDGLRRLFEAEGFQCQGATAVGKLFENRKTGERLDRRFIQAVFTFCGTGASTGGAEGSTSNAAGNGSSSGSQGCSPAVGAHKTCQVAQRQQQPAHEGQRRRHDVQQAQSGAVHEAQHLQLQIGTMPLRLACHLAAARSLAAAQALAEAVLQCRHAFQGIDVLELCVGDAPLAALATLRWCRRAVAAGPDAAAVERLRRNVRCNGHLFMYERLRLARLAWGQVCQGQHGQQHGSQAPGQEQANGQHGACDTWQGQEPRTERCGAEQQQPWPLSEHLRQVRRFFPAGFHAVLAAVPAGTSEADVLCLLRCAALLLSRHSGAFVLLCVEGLEAAAAEAAAEAAGLAVADMPAELSRVAVPPQLRLLCLRTLA